METARLTRSAPVTAIVVLALLMVGLASPVSAASNTTKIKGTISLAGAPVSSAKVQLYRNIDSDPGGDGDDGTYTRIKTYLTKKSGRYSFSGLKLKKDPKYGLETYSYLLLVTDSAGNTVKTLRMVKPRKGKTITKNVRLARAAVVTGTVRRADAKSPAGLKVALDWQESLDAFPHNPEFLSNTTATVHANGRFRIAGVSPASYDALQVSGGPYDTQCYDFVNTTLADCDTTPYMSLRLTLPAGARNLPPVTATKLKPPTSTLRGTVTDIGGTPLKRMSVRLDPLNGQKNPVSTSTNSSGRFTVPELQGGNYRIVAQDPKRVWTTRHLTRSIVAGTNLSDVNFSLKSATTTRQSVRTGSSSVKVVMKIIRRASAKGAKGSVTLSFGTLSEQVTLVKGRATAKISGVPSGKHRMTVTYSGNSNTAGYSKPVSVTIK